MNDIVKDPVLGRNTLASTSGKTCLSRGGHATTVADAVRQERLYIQRKPSVQIVNNKG